MLILSQTGRIFFLLALVLTTGVSSAFGQTRNKNNLPLLHHKQSKKVPNTNTGMSSGSFKAAPFLCSSPFWVLSAAGAGQGQNEIANTSQFYPLLEPKLPNEEFEQVQSIIIPGGIVDIANNVVYVDDTANDIVMLDINSGQVVQQINNICCPIAIVDNCLIALTRINTQTPSYDLVMLDISNPSLIKAHWSPVLMPDWLDLPADGERQKFVFSVHCYNGLLSLAWQASKRSMFPNPLSLIMSSMSQPDALQGSFSVDLKSQTIISRSMQTTDPGFLGYLTASENNLPAQIALDSNTIAIKASDPYLFSLIRAYPPEHNISRAGVVAQRELQVKDMRTGVMLWSRVLPAAFIPLPF